MNLYQRLTYQPRDAHDVAGGAFAQGQGVAAMLARASKVRRFTGGNLGGFGALATVGVLPDFTIGAGGYATRLLSTLAQPIAAVRAMQARYAPAFSTPEGAPAAAASQAYEEAIKAALADVIRIGAKYDALGPMPVPLSSETYERIKATQDAGIIGAHHADDAAKEQAAKITKWSADTDAITFEAQNSLVPKLRDYLGAYLTTIPSLVDDVQALINSKVKQQVAEQKLVTAKINTTTANADVSTYAMTRELEKMKSDAVAEAKAAAARLASSSAAATKAAGGGISPFLYVGGAIVLGGIAWYFLKGRR